MTQQRPYFDRGNPQSAQTKRAAGRISANGPQDQSTDSVRAAAISRNRNEPLTAAAQSRDLPIRATAQRQRHTACREQHRHCGKKTEHIRTGFRHSVRGRFCTSPYRHQCRHRYRHQCRHRYRHRPAFRSGLEWESGSGPGSGSSTAASVAVYVTVTRPRPPARSPNRPLHTGAPPYRLRSRRCHPQAHPRA